MISAATTDSAPARLRQLQWSALGLSLLLAAAALILSPEMPRRGLVAALASLPCFAAFGLLRRNCIDAAFSVMSWGLWAAITLGAVLNGGMQAPATYGYPFVVIIASLTLQRRQARLLAAVTLASIFLVAVADGYGLLPAPMLPQSPWVRTFVPVISFTACAFAFLFLEGLRDRLGILQQERSDLTRRMDEIGARESLLNLVVENVPAMIFHADRESVCHYANTRFQACFGTAPGDCAGRTMMELMGDENFRRFRPAVDKTLAGSRVRFVDEFAVGQAGRQRLECLLAPAPDEDGRIEGYFVQMVDITEREHGEAILRAIAAGTAATTGPEFFRSLVRHLSDALGVPYAAVAEILPGSEHLHFHAFWQADGFQNVPDAPLAACPFAEILQTEDTVFYPAGAGEAFAGRPLASLSVESFYGLPLKDATGAMLGVLAVMSRRPMHFSLELASVMAIVASRAGSELERLQALETLRNSEDRFQRIFQGSPIPIALLDITEGRIREVNDALCRAAGWPPEQILGRTSLELGFWSSPEERERWREQLTAHGRTHGHEVRFITSDGQPHWLLISSEIIELPEGPTVLSFLVDVTARKRSEETLARINQDLEQRVRQRTAELTTSNRELEAFAYSVSHDLRAPLRSIDGFSQILLADYGERLDAEGKSHLRRIRRATQRLGTVIDDLLQLSRVSRQDMHRETVNLGALVASILDDLARAEPSRKVSVRVDTLCPCQGDPMLLRILLQNLLDNAWKYTARTAQAEIEFGCGDVDGRTEYFIRDNGVGFDMAHAERLFRPFERLHRVDEFEGTGIGLASAARIVQRHGGDIRAEATPGHGATFRFTLS